MVIDRRGWIAGLLAMVGVRLPAPTFTVMPAIAAPTLRLVVAPRVLAILGPATIGLFNPPAPRRIGDPVAASDAWGRGDAGRIASVPALLEDRDRGR